MSNTPETCYLCGSHQVQGFFETPPLPTQDGVMCATVEDALKAERGRIQLRFCSSCGYVGNEGHDATKVRFDDYDFSNDQSPMYAQFNQELCQRLINRYSLDGKIVLDIGCGDGDFLRAICRQGGNHGVGIDPGFDHSADVQNDACDVRYLREYYAQRHSDLDADLVAIRHVISLPNDPLALLRLIRRNLQHTPEAVVYLETPNARYTFGDRVIWNVVYEHRSWFCLESLIYMMELAGFDVLDAGLCWNDGYLYVEARPSLQAAVPHKPDPAHLADLQQSIHGFGADFAKVMSTHTTKIAELKAGGATAVAWGAGARAVSYFNLFDLRKEVRCIVDVNPKRQGKFLPGSGHEIVGPEQVKILEPDLLIITNPTYELEIIEQVHSLGLHPEFWVL